MRTRFLTVLALIVLGTATIDVAGAAASSSAVQRVRAVYRTVLTAEYFGPASAVCSNLTAAGVKSYTAGGGGSCTHVFTEERHILRHKTKGVDDSGYTAAQWRTDIVDSVMAHLKVTVHGTHASALGGQSGIPGRTTLVEVAGHWRFSSYPPSIGS